MLNPPTNPFKRTRFEEGQPKSTPKLTNAQFAEQSRKQKGDKPSFANLIASTTSKLDVNTNFLSVLIFINQRKKPNPPRLTNRKDKADRSIRANALLDTGSLPGDFISQALVSKMCADDFVYTSTLPLNVCSGLDNTCYLRDKVIDIGLIFVTSDLVIKTLFLTLRIIPSSIDLILGRHTLKSFNFFSMTP